MAKRFQDTDLWDKEWFMALKPKLKCLVQFIFAKCDQAGVWSPNWMLASSFINEKVSIDDVARLKKQFEILPNGKIFVLDFIKFQYGELTEKCAPHRKVIALLKSHGLFERVSVPYQYPTSRVQEEEEEKEEEEDKEMEEEKQNAGAKTEIPKGGYTFAVLPWDTPGFVDAWGNWKLYKKEQHKFHYKGIHTEQAALMELSKMADGQEAKAIEILHHTTANGWKGFVKPKKDELRQSTSKTGSGLNADYKAKLFGEMAAAAGQGGSVPT